MSYIDAVAADYPEGFWLLDEESGTVAAPYIVSSGGTLIGTYVGSPTLGGTSIIGTNHCPETTSSSSILLPKPNDLPTPFTIEFWFQYVSGSGVIFRDSTSAAGTGWSIDLSGTHPTIVANGSAHTVAAVTSAALKTGRHHIALTHDATTLKFYTDGVLQDSWIGGASGATIGGPFVLGRDGTNSTFTRAKYAAFAVYPYVVSMYRIAAHYAAADAHRLNTIPVRVTQVAVQPQLRTLATIPVGVSPGSLTIRHSYVSRGQLVLASSTVTDVVAPPEATTLEVAPLHVVAPAVPTPTLVDGRPQ